MNIATTVQEKNAKWTPPPECRVVVDIAYLRNVFDLSPSAVERAMKHEGFPLAIRGARRKKLWWKAEVEEWFANRPRGIQPCADLDQYSSEGYLNRFS
jgi:predicted DNA-binding transcriptional regulator AlpA